MNAKSIDELKSDLKKFKLALEQPRLYIFNQDDQALIIEEVKSFEEACMSSLIDGELDIEFVQSINETILQIEANFNNIGFTNIEIQEQISDLKLRFHKKIFLNKTMIFMTNEHCFASTSITGSIDKLFGFLMTVEDEFIDNDTFSDWE